ncbi:MAG: nucleotidyl transferase AbiEii/AbiGii toxin family protein [Bacteroidetes bacterium]|nr:nucleotidyl transferase AbiEii/AbiGii toxin family protein [Bacteroidota bacterium]
MKLYSDTVSKNTFSVLNKLMKDEKLSSFILVGGTALSLQVGHRISIDLDLFTDKEFDKQALYKHLLKSYDFRLPTYSDIALQGFIGNLKTDFVFYENSFVRTPVVVDGIRMAGLEDIAAMKLEAIANMRNKAKDYVDIAFLSQYLSLNMMLAVFKEKFAQDELFVLRSLSAFSQISDTKDVYLSKGQFDWELIKKRIVDMIDKPSLIFAPMN